MKLRSFLPFVISITALVHSPVLAKPSGTSQPWDGKINQSQAAQEINWNTNASNLRGRLNQNFAFNCPPNGYIDDVWGTNIYTDDSSICSAAVHSGLITTQKGGRVTIRIRPGADFYNGTTRNGVRSLRYNSYPGSFIFLRSTGSPIATEPQIPLLEWNDTASNLRGRLDRNFTFDCPSNGRISSVWGTDVYTDDSSICSAAVHSGLITTRNGGRVTIKIRPGAELYNGITRNGVRSLRYNSYPGSFIFVRSRKSITAV